MRFTLVEVEPDIFYICTSDVYETHQSNLQRFDLRGWTPGSPLNPKIVLEFPDPVRALNGSCLIAPTDHCRLGCRVVLARRSLHGQRQAYSPRLAQT